MKTIYQDHGESRCIFVHSSLDDLGLDSCTFRIYAHLARRADTKDYAWPGVVSMMQICQQSRQTVINSVRKLESVNLIQVVRKHGCSNLYRLTAPSEWRKPLKSSDEAIPATSALNRPVSEIDQSKAETPPVSKIDHHRSKVGTQRVSKEGNPLKDNTVVRPADPVTTPPPEPRIPDGSSPGGEPAVSRQDAGEGGSPIAGVPAQSPLRRKSYALAEIMERFHWDNCKVRFAKETARSYAEKAMKEGCEANDLLKAYEHALHYCHGLTTDQMLNGDRGRYELATPALTVWLARERLKKDPRPIEERWKQVVARLRTEHLQAVEEDARVRAEIAAQTPAIEAWFAPLHQPGPAQPKAPTASQDEPLPQCA